MTVDRKTKTFVFPFKLKRVATEQVRLFYSLPLEENKITNHRLQRKLNRNCKAGYQKHKPHSGNFKQHESRKFKRKNKGFAMMETTIIDAPTKEEVTRQLTAYLQQNADAFQHRVSLQQDGKSVLLDIDIDPGGGFESGYATTRFVAPVTSASDFAFTIHPEGFLSDFAKLFGLQDEVLGYPEFDEKVIIKTNDKEKVKGIFSNEALRQTFSTLSSFNLQLGHEGDESSQKMLSLEMEEGITEPAALLPLYAAFVQVLNAVENTSSI